MEELDRHMLDLASRHALRGWGRAEPNPLVGCVIARRDEAAAGAARARGGGDAFERALAMGWRIIGMGHHRAFGGAHGEIEALRACERIGATPRGATAWVGLEPCNHTGKTGPCTRALMAAGLREVVYARADPNPIASGGADALRASGVTVREARASVWAEALTAPFLKRVRTGLPWVIAKWAQSAEGRMTAGPGEDRWISGDVSRRRVHRLRERVDAVMIGVGTALADDPLLTPRLRAGRRPRRTPVRVVLDSALRLPPTGALAASARESPVLALCTAGARGSPNTRALREAGVEIVEAPVSYSGAGEDGATRIDLTKALDLLARRGIASVLLEPGPMLLTAAFRAGIVDEAWAFVAGCAGTPHEAQASAARLAPALADANAPPPLLVKRSGEDALCVWRRAGG